MDDSGHRENGRHKPSQGQWLMQQQPSMKQIMAIMAERDAAIQERNLAISEKKAAFAERDLAILQRDSAISERNNAIMERDNAIATLHYRESSMNSGIKHMHHQSQQYVHNQPHLIDPPAGATRDVRTGDSLPVASPVAQEPVKAKRSKRPKETKGMISSKKTPKSPKKAKRESNEQKSSQETGSIGSKPDWKDQDLGLNWVGFDESTMPVPVCTCTGAFRPCYKWGNGGWQSSCCTMTMSMYPLPSVPNKRHARVGGRKMSGSAFSKLLSRLAGEGHDLSNPIDLKDHWAKHGTNRYITIK